VEVRQGGRLTEKAMRRGQSDNPDFEKLYHQMVRIRRFEEATAGFWHRGLISGELHLGVGEEAAVAGVVSLLEEGDAMATDHRSTPPFVARGVDLTAMTLELLGSEEGLCRGMGGHMHLFSVEKLACSTGIVGASAPLASGFALAAQQLHPGKVAVAFFGDGAMNQGMTMEALNLAAAWRLPVIFVCKNNGWAITTRTQAVTGGRFTMRARALGMPACWVPGTRVEKVRAAAYRAVRRARAGAGPSFILAVCPRTEGHFLGDPLLRVLKEPVQQAKEIMVPLAGSAVRSPGAAWASRLGSLAGISRAIATVTFEQFVLRSDPLKAARRLLPEDTRLRLEREASEEVESAVTVALRTVEGESRG